MDNFIEKKSKAIIIFMFILLLILISLLINNSSSSNLIRFGETLNNPLENVHMVMLGSPTKLDNLEVFNKVLNNINDCKDEKEVNRDQANHILIPKECLEGTKGPITPDYTNQKLIVLTPGVQKTTEGTERSILFYTNLPTSKNNPDPPHKCSSRDGWPC